MSDDFTPSPLLRGKPGETLRQTFHTGMRSVTRVSTDGGETWTTERVVWAEERARRERDAYEQHRIQVELK